MKVIALIPARYEASRYPGKLMGLLGDKSVILTTYLNTVATNLFDDVYVVTDSKIIYDEIINHHGNAIMSKNYHSTGSDRIAEACMDLDVDIVVNVQGDEPFVAKEPLVKLLEPFKDPNVQVATLMQRLNDVNLIKDFNYVKVVVDKNNDVMYFSRAPIPFNRDNDVETLCYEHIGVYAFKKDMLIEFSQMKPTPNEVIEKIEPLRLLENGIKIRAIETDYMGLEIDTPEDLYKANEYLNNLI